MVLNYRHVSEVIFVALYGEKDKWRLFAVTPCEILKLSSN